MLNTEVREGINETYSNAGFIAMYFRIDCTLFAEMLTSDSGDTVCKASVTDYAVDDPDSSYCAHVNSVLGLGLHADSAAAITPALLPILRYVGDTVARNRRQRSQAGVPATARTFCTSHAT